MSSNGEPARRRPRHWSKRKPPEDSPHDPSSSSDRNGRRAGSPSWTGKRSAEGPSRQHSSHASPVPQGNDPSVAGASAPGGSGGPSTAGSGGFTVGMDFIPFDFSDDEDEREEPPQVPSPGKGKGRERPDLDVRGAQNGVKRPAEAMEDDDRYANKKQRTDASSRLTPWVNGVDWDGCRNLAELLHKEVRAFAAYISPTPEEHEVRGMIVTIITRTIQRAWPDARISPFGSYETKLYLPLGDIDLVVESRAMENCEKRQVLYNLAQLLRRENITSNVQVIAKAKVPIIKFVTSHGRFAVDISLNQANGVTAGRIVNGLLMELPALQSLVMVVKLFLSQRSLNEVYTGGLGSYAIVCMIVSFLQMHPKIRAGEIDPSENLGVLTIEFFELYGHYFNYDNTGISLRDGGTYFNKTARGWNDFRHPSLLSIEDPIDTSNDVSKNSFNITRIRKVMAGAHEVLTAAALTRSRILISKARGEYTSLRSSHNRTREDDHQSILGSVMGVTQETLNHRRMVKQLYEQSTLQNLLGLPRYRPPEPTTLPPRLPDAPSRTRSRRAVEMAWDEADMDIEDSDDDILRARRRRMYSPEEESRYSGYPRKRRRVDSPKYNGRPANAIFVEESEEEAATAFVTHVNHVSTSARKGSGQPRDAPTNGKVEARRAYWASKGTSGGGLGESGD